MLSLLKNFNNEIIASCSIDKTIRLWNVITGECLNILEGHSDKVVSLLYLKNSYIKLNAPYLISGSFRELFMWDLNKNCVEKSFYGHRDYIWCIIWGS